MSQHHDVQTQDHFIRLQEVLFRIGVSRSNLYKLIEAGQFPAQIKIGYSSVWSNNAVNQWMNVQIALSQQDHQPTRSDQGGSHAN